MRLTSRTEAVYTLTNTNGSEEEFRIGPEPVEVPDEDGLRILKLHSSVSAIPNKGD